MSLAVRLFRKIYKPPLGWHFSSAKKPNPNERMIVALTFWDYGKISRCSCPTTVASNVVTV